MSIKDEIKSIIIKTGRTMSDVVNILNEKHGRKGTVQNFSNKLTRETLRYREAQEIAEAIGYELKWVHKE